MPRNCETGKARPDRIRLRLSDVAGPNAVALELPARTIWPVGLVVAGMFAIFAWVEWGTILRMSRHSVTDVFDLMFLLFEGFWVLGWSVGVVILAAVAVLLLFYGESARLQDGKLVYIPRLGPVMVLLDYELARIRNLRLESVGSEDAVRLRFDYRDGVTGLGDTMPRAAAPCVLPYLDVDRRSLHQPWHLVRHQLHRSAFIGRREYAGTTMMALMRTPYNRIIVMQLALILGGWVILLLKTPELALVLLVLLKTVLDFSAHRNERARVLRPA